MVRSWIAREPQREIPWTPLPRPLRDCTVALISSGGIALRTDQPFDQEGERRNPWWGDPSFRVIPADTTSEDIRVCHLHVNPKFAQSDLDCLLPMQRLEQLEDTGEIGRAAPRHYSIMGYILDPRVLLEETVPAIAARLLEDGVDIVVLVPS